MTSQPQIDALAALTGLTRWDVQSLLELRIVDRTGTESTIRTLAHSEIVQLAEFSAFTTLQTYTDTFLALQLGATLPQVLAAAAAGERALRELITESRQPAAVEAAAAARFWEGTSAQ